MEQLKEIVKLTSQPLPERPDGIVMVAKFTSTTLESCRITEADYDRLARDNPATLFLRCYQEYEDAALLQAQAEVITIPTYDIFYGGNRVARVEGGDTFVQVQEILQRYQFQNSKLDLFSEASPGRWGQNDSANTDFTKTPRTTARFIPGYDWNSDKGFFDTLGDKMEKDLMGMYESDWIPNPENDENERKR